MKIFKEEQRFTQTWLLVVMSFSIIIPIYVTVTNYINETNKISTTKFILTLSIIALSFALIFLFKLKTRIDEKGIHYQFFPFHLKFKQINWAEITTAKVRIYDPIGEYGGWGLKGSAFWNKSKGKCISISGDIGIQLELKSGKKLLIGTQKKEDAVNVLKTYKNNTNEERY